MLIPPFGILVALIHLVDVAAVRCPNLRNGEGRWGASPRLKEIHGLLS